MKPEMQEQIVELERGCMALRGVIELMAANPSLANIAMALTGVQEHFECNLMALSKVAEGERAAEPRAARLTRPPMPYRHGDYVLLNETASEAQEARHREDSGSIHPFPGTTR